jgi:YfiH family protein
MADELDEVRRYPLRVPAWAGIPGLVHGFLGRAHGLSAGSFTAGDLRQRLVAAGDPADVVLAARQVHGAEVFAPREPARAAAAWEGRPLPAALAEADALVTASRAVVTIRTADCVPILLVAPAAHAVAAVHAGWRGLLAGVVEAALATLATRHGAGAAAVRAAIGPAIGMCCYEFGAEHIDALAARLGPEVRERAWRPKAERGQLDLRAVARLALEGAGVPTAAITTVGPCTAHHPAELHSYRRDGANAGRQLSYIGWER